ncbi:MAG: glycosyltransferase family 9 protein, partial [Desulfobacula sp.]|nr:glycosyltransferase family 9 protein [Desulfobacula sp.]
MKVLIIKLGALGDVINTFPLAINIKQELHAKIHWLVAPLSFPMVKEHESVDRAIVFDRQTLGRSLKNVIKQIRQTEYDIVLDLQRLLKSGLFAMAAKGKRKIGFDRNRCKEMSWLFPFERIDPSDPNAHMLTQYLEFAKYLDIEHNRIAWNIPWQGLGFASLAKDNYIVLNIGATKPANRWDNLYFATLADMINDKTDCKVVLTGGPEDRESAELITTRANCRIIDLCGRTSL